MKYSTYFGEEQSGKLCHVDLGNQQADSDYGI
jgi:hypothetical protein